MKSSFFESLGLSSPDPGILFIILMLLFLIVLVLLIVQTVRLGALKKRYEGFMTGRDGRSMEKEIKALFEDIRAIQSSQKTDRKNIRYLKEKLTFTYQKMGLVRYDAFNQMGGGLSFSLALLNDEDDGIIINSVHSSDGCYSYAKEIRHAKCAIALGEEEQQALDKALGEQDII